MSVEARCRTLLHLQWTCCRCLSSALAELNVTLEIHGARHMTQQAPESLVNKLENTTASHELLKETDENTKASWNRFIIDCAVKPHV